MFCFQKIRWLALPLWLLLLLIPIVVSAGGKANGLTQIVVAAGDVDGLYQAVYDENGEPRNKVDIVLEGGVYTLDPARTNDGRLVLGRKTILRSSLSLMTDSLGRPVVDENGLPTIVQPGATIDASNLASQIFGEGTIVVGRKGKVENLTVMGGFRPGVEITTRGTIRGVYVTDASVGLRIRSTRRTVRGTLTGNLTANNGVYGMGVIALDPDLPHTTGEAARLRATLRRNTSAQNAVMNFYTHGGIGTDHSELVVNVHKNLFVGSPALASVRVTGGFDFQGHGSGNENAVTIHFSRNDVIGANIGLRVESTILNAGFLSDPTLPLAERQSHGNEVEVILSENNFNENALADIIVYGARSDTGEPAGSDNAATVLLYGSAAGLVIEQYDCYPAESFPNCENTATVEIDDD